MALDNDNTEGTDVTDTSDASVVQISPDNTVQLPAGVTVGSDAFERDGQDLVITQNDGSTTVVEDYFASEPQATLMTETGGRLTGELVTKLAGPMNPGEYAQAGGPQAGEPIGHVDQMDGDVYVIRNDGTKVQLDVGDPVYQGDALETGPEGAVGIILADQTTFSMAENGSMVLDEMVYDPGTDAGSMNFSVVKGVFTFVSGQVAKTDPDAMTIETPVATIGIRGTQVGVDFANGEDLQVVLMEESDGFVGEIVVWNEGGTKIINMAGFGTIVKGFDLPPVEIFEVSEDQLINIYGTTFEYLPTEVGTGNDYGMQNVGNFDDFATAAGGNEELIPGSDETPDTSQTTNSSTVAINDTDTNQIEGFDGGADSNPTNGLGVGNQPTTIGADEGADPLNGGPETGTGSNTPEGSFDYIGDDGVRHVGLGEGVTSFSDPNSDVPINMDESDNTNNLDITTGSGDDNITTGSGNDIINAGNGNNTINAGDGDNQVTTGSGNDNITTGSGDDSISSGDGDDIVDAGAGNDSIDAAHGGGNDTYDGGDGIDTIDFDSSTQGVLVDLEEGTATDAEGVDPYINSDTLSEIENVIGGDGNDEIRGDDGDNVLSGGSDVNRADGVDGDDILEGRGGNDTLDGGEGGMDTAVFSGNYADYAISEVDDNLQVADSVADRDGTDTLIGIETIEFADGTYDVATGEFAATSIEVVGGDDDDVIDGGAGDDQIDGGGGNDQIQGTTGDDTLSGGDGDDTIDGGEGDDQITGTDGNDILTGGDGADNIDGGAGDDVIVGSDGDDVIVGGDDNDTIDGGAGDDTITASDGNDIVQGGEGNDTIVAAHGGGNDTYDGGDGIDTIKFESAENGVNVNLEEGTATDATDTYYIGDDVLTNIENVVGSPGNDDITGDAQVNALYAGTGDDILDGGEGDDILDGGEGADTAIFSGNSADYNLIPNEDGSFSVVGIDGTDMVSNIETLTFDNGSFEWNGETFAKVTQSTESDGPNKVSGETSLVNTSEPTINRESGESVTDQETGDVTTTYDTTVVNTYETPYDMVLSERTVTTTEYIGGETDTEYGDWANTTVDNDVDSENKTEAGPDHVEVNVNEAPDAGLAELTGAEDTALVITEEQLLKSATDADGDTLSVTNVSGENLNGTLEKTGEGEWTFTPNDNWNGSFDLTYTVSDHFKESTGTVSVTMPNDNADSTFVTSYETNSVTQDIGDPALASRVTNNVENSGVESIDLETGDTITTYDTIVTETFVQPTLTTGYQRTVTVETTEDGTVLDPVYGNWDEVSSTPGSRNYDESYEGDPNPVVTDVNEAPDAVADTGLFGGENETLTINVLENDTDADGDTLSVSNASVDGGGKVSVNGDGTITFDPGTDFDSLAEGDNATVTITYEVSDGYKTNTATATVTVEGSNDGPVFDGLVVNGTIDEDNLVGMSEDDTFSAILEASDGDTGDELTYSFASETDGPAHGEVTFGADGAFTYTPTDDYTGEDEFTVTISDKQGSSTTATVKVDVAAINDAATVSAPSLVVSEGATVGVGVADLGVSDVDTADAGVTIQVSNVANGSFTLDGVEASSFTLADVAAGKVSFTHDGGEDAPSFSVSASDDGQTYSDPVAAQVNFTNVNDTPQLTTDLQGYFTDGQAMTLDASEITVTDAESGANDITFTLTDAPDFGALYRVDANGAQIPLDVNDTFTQADINSGTIQYQQTSNDFSFQWENSTPSWDNATIGVDSNNLKVPDGADSMTVTFQGEEAGYKNAVGWYKITTDPQTGEQTYSDPDIIWHNASQVGSGGDLVVDGSSVTFNNLSPGEEIGFFIIQNADDKVSRNSYDDGGDYDNLESLLNNDQRYLEFDSSGDLRIVAPGKPSLTVDSRDNFHSGDASTNDDGMVHVKSGIGDDGELHIGFEDLDANRAENDYYHQNDNDFDDVKFSVTFDGPDQDIQNDSFTFTAADGDGYQVADSDGDTSITFNLDETT